MCGRYTNTAGVEELNERFKVPFPGEQGTRRYNVAPSEEVLAIVSPKGTPEARLLRWGLIPPWANDLKAGYKMINAKLETVTSQARLSQADPARLAPCAADRRRLLRVAEARAPRHAAPALSVSRRRRRAVRLRGAVDAREDRR